MLTPLLEGMEGERSSELPFLSSLCGACHEACPVGIPLHDLLVRVRGRTQTPAHRRDRMRFRLWSRAWSNPLGYRASIAMARLGLRAGGPPRLGAAPAGPGGDWTDQRDLPTRWPPT